MGYGMGNQPTSPNKGLELTAYSRSSGPALGFKRSQERVSEWR